MSVKLIHITPLWLISNGIRYSHNNHNLSDSYWVDGMGTECIYCGSQELEESINKDGSTNASICKSCGSNLQHHIGSKDFNLIKRVGFHMNHSSVLEHSLIVFDIELSTKALLEFTRHRVGISYTVTSSRYALDTMGIEFEDTKDHRINTILNNIKLEVDELLENSSKKDFDQLAMLLPQAFIYKMQVSFNLRSLVHFLKLRTNKSAHYSIRKIAFQMIDALPLEYQELVLLDEKIKKDYEKLRSI